MNEIFEVLQVIVKIVITMVSLQVAYKLMMIIHTNNRMMDDTIDVDTVSHRNDSGVGNSPPSHDAAFEEGHPTPGIPQLQPPVYSGSSKSPPDGRRLLHIYHDGSHSRRVFRITDSDKTTVLYNSEWNNGGPKRSPKPHLQILNAITGATIGSMRHKLWSGVETVVHDQVTIVEKLRTFSPSYKIRSRTAGQLQLRWKRHQVNSWHRGLQCVSMNAKDQVHATFQWSKGALRKQGKLELGPAVQGLLMDVIVITGLAVMEEVRRMGCK